MENITKRIYIKLVSNPNTLQKLINKPYFKDVTIYNENLAAVQMEKTKLKFDKPIYVGMAILNSSKTIMYKHHYDEILDKYGHADIRLLYMATDSFIYFIYTTNLYKDILTMRDIIDTSNYPTHHPCFSIDNKKVMGKFKGEAKMVHIITFVGLRPKMYFIEMKEKQINKIKGININVVQKEITIKDYMACLREQKLFRHRMMQIKPHQHVSTIDLNKLSLSPYEDKRVILEDGESTLAFGHYKLDE